MLRIKNGVTPRNLAIAAAIANVAHEHGRTVTISEGTNGREPAHLAGNAVTMATTHFPSLTSKLAFLAALRIRLGRRYQVVLKNAGADNEHVFVLFSPL